jgi:hypothetical protein
VKLLEAKIPPDHGAIRYRIIEVGRRLHNNIGPDVRVVDKEGKSISALPASMR